MPQIYKVSISKDSTIQLSVETLVLLLISAHKVGAEDGEAPLQDLVNDFMQVVQGVIIDQDAVLIMDKHVKAVAVSDPNESVN